MLDELLHGLERLVLAQRVAVIRIDREVTNLQFSTSPSKLWLSNKVLVRTRCILKDALILMLNRIFKKKIIIHEPFKLMKHGLSRS